MMFIIYDKHHDYNDDETNLLNPLQFGEVLANFVASTELLTDQAEVLQQIFWHMC